MCVQISTIDLVVLCRVDEVVHSVLVVWFMLTLPHPQLSGISGVKGVMYDRNFVSSVLSLIGQHCPDVSGCGSCVKCCGTCPILHVM